MLREFSGDLVRYLPFQVLMGVYGLMIIPIFTHLFDPAVYGDFRLVIGMVTFLGMLAPSSLHPTVVRLFSKYRVEARLDTFITNLTIMSTVWTLTVALLAWLVLGLRPLPFTDRFYSLAEVGLLVFLVMSAYTVLANGVIRARQKIGWFTASQVVKFYGSLLVGLGLLWLLEIGIAAMLWGTFFAMLLFLPLVWRQAVGEARFALKAFRLVDATTMWEYAWPLALGNLGLWGLQTLDRYLLASYRSNEEVGLYSISGDFSGQSIVMLCTVLLVAAGPILMKSWETEGREKTERLISQVMRFLLIAALPAATVLSVLAEPVIRLLAEPAYLPGYRIVGFVAVGALCYGLSRVYAYGLLFYKKTILITLTTTIAVAVNAGLNVLMIPRYGFFGAGIATLVSYALLLVLQAGMSRRYFTWRFPLRTLLNVVVSSGLAGVASYGVFALCDTVLVWSVAVGLGLSGAAGIIVYGAGLAALGEFTRQEIEQGMGLLRFRG